MERPPDKDLDKFHKLVRKWQQQTHTQASEESKEKLDFLNHPQLLEKMREESRVLGQDEWAA